MKNSISFLVDSKFYFFGLAKYGFSIHRKNAGKKNVKEKRSKKLFFSNSDFSNLDAMGGEKVCLFLILFLSKNLWIF